MKKLLITAVLFLITAGAFAQTASTLNNQVPAVASAGSPTTLTGPVTDSKLGNIKKDIRHDAKDARADINDIKLDIRSLKNEIKQRRIDIKNGDKGAAIVLTKEIRRDKIDIRTDRRDIRADKRDIRRDIRHARKIEHHLHHLNHAPAVNKAAPAK